MRLTKNARGENSRAANGGRRMRVLIAGSTALAVGIGVTASTSAMAGQAFDGQAQTVNYRGLALEVPKNWQVHDLEAEPNTCVRYDKRAVYLGTASEDQDCPARAVGRTEAIHVEPANAAVNFAPGASVVQPGDISEAAFGGDTSHESQLALSGTGLSVTASYGEDPELVRSILSDAEYDGPTRATVLPPTEPQSATDSPNIPAGGSATRAYGRGFDTCAAPSKKTMKAWGKSPFRTVGIYIGGMNRACGDGNLSKSWVKYTTSRGWRLLPIYVGRQAKCAHQTDMASISSSKAASQGRAAAKDAIKKAKKFGLGPGSTLYNDMEGYGDSASCRKAVMTFLSAWTKRLHDSGYLSGVYSSASSGIRDLARNYFAKSVIRPDVIWTANWDGDRSIWGEKYVSDSKWHRNQRVKQYRGPHRETHGGRTIEIDSNFVNAMVGTAAYSHKVTAKEALNVRGAPKASAAKKRTVAPGGGLSVRCQISGQKIKSTKVWNKLTDGGYVSNAYVNTGGGNGWSSKIPRCQFPYQVITAKLRVRSGPSTSHKAVGSIPHGGLANVVCQKSGQKIGKTRVWNKLENGTWVSDWYVASPGRTKRTYTSGIPRC